jgi:pyrroline-5-carboxylate reductase
MTIDIGGPLLLVGAGKMGSAMASGWLEQGLAADALFIQDPTPCADAQKLIDEHNLVSGNDLELPNVPVIIVLAIKPQMMAEILPALAAKAGPHTLFLSIAAGQNLETLANHLGDNQPIVRSMPNTPASIGQGMSVACSNDFVTPDQVEHCITLLSAVGEIAWIEDEAQMDAVTAVSGSGPAYLFALTECLALAGIKQGLDKKLAWQLATTTMEGAAALMRRSCDNPVVLRKNVTSPGGTTEAALGVLMGKKGLARLIDKTIDAATKRSKELSG